MQLLFRSVIVALIVLASVPAFASPANPVEGIEYQTLALPQAVPAGGKVEVIAFFGYFCNHCHALDRSLTDWVSKQNGKILFKRIPVAPREARLYFALEEMGMADQLHKRLFHAVQVERQRLGSEQAAADFVARHGIDREAFLQHYHSFAVQNKVNSLKKMSADYKVDGVPLIVVAGRYLTSPAIVSRSPGIGHDEASLHAATLQVLNKLVQKAGQ